MTQPPSAHLATSDEGGGARAAAGAEAEAEGLGVASGCSDEMRIANCEMRNAKGVHCPSAEGAASGAGCGGETVVL
jgi:hypothetical protein